MSVINLHSKEISVKVVFYGCGLCGKTTSLQTIYASLPPDRRPQIVSLATEVDRTIFFDFLPVTAYRIRDFRVRLQLYTVPGQVFYNATRKLVLSGVDGIVFVADSQQTMRDSNLESLQNLQENLHDLGLDPTEVPTVVQFNKRDLREIYTVDEMDGLYNPRKLPCFATVATQGEGLFDVLRAISQLVVNNLLRRGLGRQLQPEQAAAPTTSESIGAAAAAAMAAPAAATTAPVPEPAVASAAAPAAVSSVPVGALWPGGSLAGHTQPIDAALARAAWGEVVVGVDAFLRFMALNWAQSAGHPTGDPVPTFLLMRGLSSTRYRALMECLPAAQRGEALERGHAMNALIVALEATW